MPDWTRGFERQTYEFFEVDPATWRDLRPLRLVRSCRITRDADSELLESARFEVDEDVPGEAYWRAYMTWRQGSSSGRECMGTFLSQTPKASYDGKAITRSVDAYSPLVEASDRMPPVGRTFRAGATALGSAVALLSAHMRAPVVSMGVGTALTQPWTCSAKSSALEAACDLLAVEGMHLDVLPDGRVSLAPDASPAALSPAWTYDDGNSSILLPDVTEEYDWYGVPNVVEVVWSSGSRTLVGKAVNDGENPLSVASRGREVLHRETSPTLPDDPTQDDADMEAARLLAELSSVERTVTYEHGYCPVRIGDSVLLDYSRHGLRARARVTKQEIVLETGCIVRETATYTESLI